MDNRQHVPSDSIGANKVTKKASNVPKSVGFVSMNGIVILRELLFEEIRPKAIDLRKSLPNETIKFGISSFLSRALDDH
jgi:hypothetical protein